MGGPERRLRIDYADPGPYSFVSPSRSGSANPGAGDQIRREETADEFYHNNRNSGEFNDHFDRRSQRDFGDDIKREYPISGNNGSNYGESKPVSSRNGSNCDHRSDIEPDRKRARRMSGSPNAFDDRSMTSWRRSRGADSIGRGSPNYETNGKDDITKVTVNENVTTIPDLIKCCPPALNGGFLRTVRSLQECCSVRVTSNWSTLL